MKFALVVLLTLAAAACGSPEERAAAYLREAQTFYDKGDDVNARLEAMNAVQILPKDARAQYLLAQIAERQQDFRSMIQRLLATVSADPDMVAARVRLGTLYFVAEAYDQAAEQAAAATRLAAEDPEVRTLNARLALHRGEQDVAVRELEAALAQRPDLLDAIVMRAAVAETMSAGRGLPILDEAIVRLPPEESKPLRQARINILTRLDRQADVEQSFRELIRDFPDEQSFQVQLARFYSSQGRVGDAEEVLREVVTRDAGDVGAQLGLTQFLAQMRSPEEAERTLEAFVAESPSQPELRMALGRLYETNRKPDAALAAYEELAAAEPNSRLGIAARVRVAALRIVKGEFAEGRSLLDAVLADEPGNADALLIRADLNAGDASFEEALADVRAALRRQPENRGALLLLARIHGATADQALAKDAYRQLLAIDPGNASALGELVTLHVRDNETSAAIGVLRAHLSLRPDDVDAGARLVSLLGSQQAWSQAEAEARRMAELPGSRGAGQFQLGRVFRAQGKEEAAVKAFRSALEDNPASIAVLESLTITLDDMGRKAEARQVIQDFRAKHPDDVTGRFLEGNFAVWQGDKSGARQIFSEIVSANPAMPMAWVALAALEDDDAAARIVTYQQGLAANPGSGAIGVRLGAEYVRAGRFADAMAHYEKLLAANPRIEIARNDLASLLLDYRQDAASHARALELVKPLARSSDPLVLDTVGWAYYRNKEFGKAVRYLERAVRGAAERPQLRYHLGMAYLATGNTPGAIEELRRAISPAAADYPGSAEARARLAELRS